MSGTKPLLHAEYEQKFLEAELSDGKGKAPSIQLPVNSTVLDSVVNHKASYPPLTGSWSVDQFLVELERVQASRSVKDETEDDVKALGLLSLEPKEIQTLSVAWLHPLELFVDEHIFRARDFERAICSPLYWKSLADPARLPFFPREAAQQLDEKHVPTDTNKLADKTSPAPAEWSTCESHDLGFDTALLFSKDSVTAAVSAMAQDHTKAYVQSLLNRVVNKFAKIASPMMAMYTLLFVGVWGEQLASAKEVTTKMIDVLEKVKSATPPQQTPTDLEWDDLQQLVQLTIQFLHNNTENKATITYLVRSWRTIFGAPGKEEAKKPEYTFCTKVLEPLLRAAYQEFKTKTYKTLFNPDAYRLECALSSTGWTITSPESLSPNIVHATRNNTEAFVFDTSMIYKDAKTGREYISFRQRDPSSSVTKPTSANSSAAVAAPSVDHFLCHRLDPAPLFCRREYSVVNNRSGKYYQAGPAGDPVIHWEDKDIVNVFNVFNDGKSWPASFVNLVLSSVPDHLDRYPDHVAQLGSSTKVLPQVNTLPEQYTRRWYKTNAGIELAIDTDHHINSKSVFRFVFSTTKVITLNVGWQNNEQWVIQSTLPDRAKRAVSVAEVDARSYKAVAPYIWECDKRFLVAKNVKTESYAMVVQGRQHVVDLVPLKWGGVDVDTANLSVLEDVAAILTSSSQNKSTGLSRWFGTLLTSQTKNDALEYATTHLLRRYFFLKPNDTSLLTMYERKAEEYQMHSSLFSNPLATKTKEDIEVESARVAIGSLFDKRSLRYKRSEKQAPTASADQFYADWISRPANRGTDTDWTRLDLLWANRGRLYQEQQRVIQTRLEDTTQDDESRKEYHDTTWKLWDLQSDRTAKQHRTMALYECLSGRLVRKAQYVTFRAIVEQVDDTKEQTIQHLLMGGGKTAVITPMLVLDRYVKMMKWYWLQQTRLPGLAAEINNITNKIELHETRIQELEYDNQTESDANKKNTTCKAVIDRILQLNLEP